MDQLLCLTDDPTMLRKEGRMLLNQNIVQPQVMYEVLGGGQCHRPDGGRNLVLDVGANFGYFALGAASYGCR